MRYWCRRASQVALCLLLTVVLALGQPAGVAGLTLWERGQRVTAGLFSEDNEVIRKAIGLFVVGLAVYALSTAAEEDPSVQAGEPQEVGRSSLPGGTQLVWPVTGRISSGYGYRIHPISGQRHFHEGIDIAVPQGTKVQAAASGVVSHAGWMSGFGHTVVIDHGNGVASLYGHNSELKVASGQKVHRGQVIALSGSSGNSTGPHLDFRVYVQGQTVDPRDYLP